MRYRIARLLRRVADRIEYGPIDKRWVKLIHAAIDDSIEPLDIGG